MRSLAEVVLLTARTDRVELLRWVEQGWVVPAVPAGPSGEPAFSELDVARVRLICELRQDLAIGEEALPLVLSLLDQLYGLRRQIDRLTDAIQEQPSSIRQAILARLAESARQASK
jgi:chaperone modulatory protein CbpM